MKIADALHPVVHLMLGRTPPAPIDPGLEEPIVRLASAHLVLPALAPAATGHVSGELGDFLLSVAAANAERNARLRRDLVALTHALNARGIEPVVLKGGAFLVASKDACPWRFLGDLDLLVDPSSVDEAVAAAGRLGLAPDHSDYEADRDAHLPALLAPDGVTAFELHTRLFAGSHGQALDVALARDTDVVEIGGARLRMPSPVLRLAHLLAHSQLHHGFHARHRILLRDILDMARLAPPDALIVDALRLFPDATEAAAARSLLHASAILLGNGTSVTGLQLSDRRWAAQAIGRLGGHACRRRLGLLAGGIRAELARAATEPGRARRLGRLLLDPDGLARRLRKRASKLRQTLWA